MSIFIHSIAYISGQFDTHLKMYEGIEYGLYKKINLSFYYKSP